MIYTQNLTATGGTVAFTLKPGESMNYSASGIFTGTAQLQRSRDGVQGWEAVATGAADTAISGTVKNESTGHEAYRVFLSGTVTGTLVVTMTPVPAGQVKRIVNAAGQAKAGTTAGWVAAAANNVALVTLPAGQTGATLVVPLPHFRPGDIITGFHLIGQIESAGNTVTVNADLRRQVAAAADVVDGSVGAITQLSVTADAVMSRSNTRKTDLYEVVTEDETLYVLITATTGASTDIALQGVAIEYKEA